MAVQRDNDNLLKIEMASIRRIYYVLQKNISGYSQRVKNIDYARF